MRGKLNQGCMLVVDRHAQPFDFLRCSSDAGTRAELYELQALPQLALIEWRDTCDGLVKRDRQGQLSTTAEEFRMSVAQALGATACAGLGVAIMASSVIGQSTKRSI